MKRMSLIILLLVVTCFPKGGQVTNHNVDLIDTLYNALQEIYTKSPLLIDVDLQNSNNDEIWKHVKQYWDTIKVSEYTSYDKRIEDAKISTLYTYAMIKFDTSLSRLNSIYRINSLLSDLSFIHYSNKEGYLFNEYLKSLNNTSIDFSSVCNYLCKNFDDSLILKYKEKLFELLPSSSNIYDSIPFYSLTLTPRMKNIDKKDTSHTVKILTSASLKNRMRMGDDSCIDSIGNEYKKLCMLLKKHRDSKDIKMNEMHSRFSNLLSIIMDSKNRKLIQLVINHFNEPVYYEELYEESYFHKVESSEPKSCSTSFQYFILPYFQDFHKGDEFIDKELDKFIFGINDGEWTDTKKVELFFKKLNKWFYKKYGVVPEEPYPKWIRQKPIKPISVSVS